MIEQLMRRYHYGSVASLLNEPIEIIDAFMVIMEVEGKAQKEEQDKIERQSKSRRR